MDMKLPENSTFDIFVVGGGVNGCGIARDAAGRGLSVFLCERGDLAQATSSASTKLFHGGLRYLEHFEFRLVREALKERETLLRCMPHISWPMRFVLPVDPDLVVLNDNSKLSRAISAFSPFLRGRRPPWLLRSGLFLYDNLGGRRMLPGTRALNLHRHASGVPLKRKFRKAFEYSDCWVQDSRLVVLNACDAAAKGAFIRTRTNLVNAKRFDGRWRVHVNDLATGTEYAVQAGCLINAAGPWADEVLRNRLQRSDARNLRLVRGSHIVVRKLFDHDQPYIFQQPDGRIVFAIPFEGDFCLIGTTDVDHDGNLTQISCTSSEQNYLLNAIDRYLDRPVKPSDVVWSYAGVRPLLNDSESDPASASRDYTLTIDDENGLAPLLNVFGGKITTYRRLAESALETLAPYFPQMSGPWTAQSPLPGGDFEIDDFDRLAKDLVEIYAFLSEAWAQRLVRAYGTLAFRVYGNAQSLDDIGEYFGSDLYEREVEWLVDNEWARSADDVIWRRSKLGLKLSAAQKTALNDGMKRMLTKRQVPIFGNQKPD
ncbi:MAG: glycerol-3-phosphate dehydrogenase [Albidovulum sp.]|nr:glycerol-3-phosphate dehydrogenase [Albidovulum sp.]